MPPAARRAAAYVATFLLGIAVAVNLAFVLTSANYLLDFGSFLAAGEAARAGENPYGPDSPLVFHVEYPEFGVGGALVNLNPPVTVLLFRLLPASDSVLAANLWRGASLLAYVAALLLLARSLPARPTALAWLWAASLAGFWHTLQLGQLYTLLALLLAASIWAEARDRRVLAGIFIGLIAAIKPNFLLLILGLALGGRRRTATAALLAFVAVTLLPLPVHGAEIYAQWLAASRPDAAILGMPGNNSLAGLTTRLGAYEVGLLLALVLAAVFLARLRRSPDDSSTLPSDVGLLFSLLAAPIAWTGYTILLLPAFLSRRPWGRLLTLSAAILAVPILVPLVLFEASRLAFVVWGWFYGWGLILLLGKLWLELRGAPSRPPVP